MLATLGIVPAKIARSESLPALLIEAQRGVMYPDYEQAKSNQLIARAESLKGKRTGQCVIAVRSFLGISRSEIQGYARNTKINSHTPQVGAIIVLRMSSAGHVGVVLQVTDQVMYYDSNGDNKLRSNVRIIKINDPRIKGYRII